MKTYIALLRGINVSGHKLIKMEKLREVLKELELEHISTYIQSGNIFLFKYYFEMGLSGLPQQAQTGLISLKSRPSASARYICMRA